MPKINLFGRKLQFNKCILCQKPYQRKDRHTGRIINILSGYPFCINCCKKAVEDAEFQAFIRKKYELNKINSK